MTDEMDRKLDGLQRDVRELGGTVRELVATVRDMGKTLRRVAATTSNTGAELADLKKYVRQELVTKDEFHERMDGFAGRLEDFKLHSAHQEDRISQLEKRRPQS